MARVFNAASSLYLNRASAVVTAAPFTVSLWFSKAALGSAMVLFEIGVAASANNRWTITTNTTDSLLFTERTTSSQSATTSNTITAANTWQHVLIIYTTTTNKIVILNGDTASQGANTTARTPAGINTTNIGASAVPGTYWTGSIAEVAVWNTNLTTTTPGGGGTVGRETDVLWERFSPLLVRPQNLVAYWPLMGVASPEISVVSRSGTENNYPMTLQGVGGPTKGAHCPIIKGRQVLSGQQYAF